MADNMIERRMIVKGTNGIFVHDWTDVSEIYSDEHLKNRREEMDRRILEGKEKPNISPKILSYVVQERTVTDWKEIK